MKTKRTIRTITCDGEILLVTGNGLERANRPRLNTKIELPNEGQVELCRRYIARHSRPTPRYNTAHTSYGYKHAVERACHVEGRHRYVSNGAFIEAALCEGYAARRASAGLDELNAEFKFRVPKAEYDLSLYNPATGEACTFVRFLERRRDRDSTIGDFARMFIGKVSGVQSLDELLERLDGLATQAAKEIWQEYARFAQ